MLNCLSMEEEKKGGTWNEKQQAGYDMIWYDGLQEFQYDSFFAIWVFPQWWYPDFTPKNDHFK